jgi:hypothetical protein
MPWSWSSEPYHPPSHKDKNSPSCGPSIPQQQAGRLYSNMFCPVDPAKEPLGTLPDMQTAAEVLDLLSTRHGCATCKPLFAAVGFDCMAEGEYAIKRRFQSKRAQRCIRLQMFPRTFR